MTEQRTLNNVWRFGPAPKFSNAVELNQLGEAQFEAKAFGGKLVVTASSEREAFHKLHQETPKFLKETFYPDPPKQEAAI